MFFFMRFVLGHFYCELYLGTAMKLGLDKEEGEVESNVAISGGCV